MITRLKQNLPELVLIDLDKLPSYGRAIATMVRASKSVRHLPIVFAGGAPDKIERTRLELPDAIYTDWKKAAAAVAKALKAAPVVFVAPIPHMKRYEGSALAKKLDLKSGVRAALIGPEDGFVELLGEMEEGVELQTRISAQTKLVLWFVRASDEIVQAFDLAQARMRWGVLCGSSIRRRPGRFAWTSIRTISD